MFYYFIVFVLVCFAVFFLFGLRSTRKYDNDARNDIKWKPKKTYKEDTLDLSKMNIEYDDTSISLEDKFPLSTINTNTNYF